MTKIYSCWKQKKRFEERKPLSQIHCDNVNELFDLVGLEALDGAVKSCIPTSSVLKQELHLQLLQKEIQNMKEKDKSEANEKFQKSLKQAKLRYVFKF